MSNNTAVKTVIITGGNSGLGFECAKTIAHADQGWHIVLACRSTEKGIQAVKTIISETGSKNIIMMQLDLSSLESVRTFVKEYQNQNYPPLKGLICNAGLMVNMTGKEIEYTKDGFESTFGVNHLGHFLLTNLLLDQFAEPGRIIVVSSNTHNSQILEGGKAGESAHFSSVEKLAHPDISGELSGMQRYRTSKLCNLLFTYELDRRLKSKGINITVNAFDPGFTPGTNLSGGSKSIRRKIMGSWFGKAIFKKLGVITSTPEKSGQAMGHLLLDRQLENTSGKYFQILEEISSSEESYNHEKAKELWEGSRKLTNYQGK